jgi:hypothetical protein
MDQQMNSQDILRNAASIYNERGKQYGDVAFMFDTAAAMATLMTGREFSAYDITTVLEAVKLARRRVNPANPENYIDGVNYMTFSAQFAKLPSAPIAASIVDDGIAEFAKKFAPIHQQESEGA